jgi:manganese transport protein
VCLTGLDVLLLLYLQNKGFRWIEALVISLTSIIGGCFLLEILFSRPDVRAVLGGFVPRWEVVQNPQMLYVAIGILGATVMPHNLYLHSSIVQTRKFEPTAAGKREAIRFATLDSTVALMFALFINAGILIVAAATFHQQGRTGIAEIQEAHRMLSPMLGVPVASTLFALALLASGQNSTLTGTLAGQIVMEGFLSLRLRPWLRRLLTRLLAIVPAVIVAAVSGESGTARLLVFSQVVLSLQLSFAVIPLVWFVSDRRKLGEFVSPRWLTLLAWLTAALIVVLNVKYLLDFTGVTSWLTRLTH